VGLKPWEFEELTPAEWGWICEAHGTKEERLDYRAALICAVLANCHRNPKAKPFQPRDFMPQKQHEQTPEDMMAMIRALNAVLGGEDETKKG
jgi:hypothetical protein